MSTASALNEAGNGAERVIPTDDPRWQALYRIIDENALLRGRFKLSAGGESTYFFQLRQATLHGEGARLIGQVMVEFMREHAIKCLGGLEMGAVPLVTAAACAGAEMGYPVDAFFVRKQAKSHGARELVDGYVSDGADILAVDDVTTTGGSLLKALAGLAETHNCTINWGLSVVDREEGAAQELAKHGIRLVSIFRKSDFGV